jgi:hypothetical protein
LRVAQAQAADPAGLAGAYGLDCCYSGAFARGVAVRGDRSVAVDEEFSQGTGRIVLTASNATEFGVATIFLMAVQAGKTTPAAINSYLSTVALAGLSRTVKFQSNGENNSPPVYLYRIRGGAITPAGTLASG